VPLATPHYTSVALTALCLVCGKPITMDRSFECLKENAPNKAFIGLFAAEGTAPFYDRYGFEDYPPSMTGIFRVAPI